MITLFLTSAGIKVPIIGKEFAKLLPKPPKQLNLVHIITASKVVDDISFVEKDRKVMKKLGFNILEYDLDNKSPEQIENFLEKANIIYVQGGNGFYLLKKIKESGFDIIIKKLLKKNIIYVGVSAGTYVACPTIEMHTWKRKSDNFHGLKNLTALNLIPFLISVHYNREKYKKLLSSKIPTASYPVKILTDNQALIIKNNKIKLVGKGKEIQI